MQEIIQSLYNNAKYSFFTDFFAATIALVACYVWLKEKPSPKYFVLFPYYFIYYFLLLILFYANLIFSKILPVGFFVQSDYIFSIFEYITFSVFFQSIFLLRRNRIFLRVLFVLFILFAIFSLVRDYTNYNFLQHTTHIRVYVLEGILLVTLCICYYTELFTVAPIIKLSSSSTFWIVTGIFFTMLCSLPFNFFEEYLLNSNMELYYQLYSINYVFYGLLFIMLIKGRLCKLQEIK